MKIPKIPNEYLGEYGKNCGYTTTNPRKWTKEEIKWAVDLKAKAFSTKEIAISLDRSETSVSIKMKRLGKKINTYNKNHIEEKYELNNLFLEVIKPKNILDLYCGTNSYYKNYNVTTNDINKNIKADYNEDAFKLLCKLYYENKKYDLIDLDPFGSAYDCFDLTIKMAKKGLIITLGEIGHKKWKRLDYVKTHYNIEKLEDFTTENIIDYIQKIGLRNKKYLYVWEYREWQNISRVYFIVKDRKVTEQWEKSKRENGQMSLFNLGGRNEPNNNI